MKIKTEKIGNRKGFTLVEILIGSVLVGVVILGIITLYLSDVNLFRTDLNRFSLQNEANIAIEHIAKHIRKRGVNANVISDDYLQVKLGDVCVSPPCAAQYRLVDRELQYCDTYFPWCGVDSVSVAKNISQLNFEKIEIDKEIIVKIKIILFKNEESLEVSSQVRL